VIAHADPQHASGDVQDECRENGSAIDEKQSGERPDVKTRHAVVVIAFSPV
jgi:hypothetical protein